VRRKFLAVFLSLSLPYGEMSSAFGSLNLKTSLDLCTSFKITGAEMLPEVTFNNCKYFKEASKCKPGVSVAAEYMIDGSKIIPALEPLTFGLGIKYLTRRRGDDGGIWDEGAALSCLPVYLVFQLNPFLQLDGLKKFYLKFDIGWIASVNLNLKPQIEADLKEDKIDGNASELNYGLYRAISLGYEFPFGLIFELSYNLYPLSFGQLCSEYDEINSYMIHLDYSVLGINIGYKLNI
jgi:hypothetical protein